MLLSELISQDIPLKKRGSNRYWTSSDHPSLIVDDQRGKWNWYGKHEWGDAWDWLRWFRNLTPAEIREILGQDDVQRQLEQETRPPLDLKIVAHACANLHKGWAFLSQRGIEKTVAERLKFGYLPGKIVLPHYGPDGTLLAIRYRLTRDWITEDGRTVRYFSEEGSVMRYPYGVWDLPNGGEVLFIVEGEFKTAIVRQLGQACIGTQGLLFRREWLYFLKGWQRVVYLRDTRDLGGVISATDFKKTYPNGEVYRVPSPFKAIDDFYKEDPEGCRRLVLAITQEAVDERTDIGERLPQRVLGRTGETP